MKEISRAQIEKKIKKEYKEARDFVNQDAFSRRYKMMIDLEDGEIWSDTFLTENDWNVYHSDYISDIEARYYGSVKEKEQAYIEEAIDMLKEVGWTIIE